MIYIIKSIYFIEKNLLTIYNKEKGLNNGKVATTYFEKSY